MHLSSNYHLRLMHRQSSTALNDVSCVSQDVLKTRIHDQHPDQNTLATNDKHAELPPKNSLSLSSLPISENKVAQRESKQEKSQENRQCCTLSGGFCGCSGSITCFESFFDGCSSFFKSCSEICKNKNENDRAQEINKLQTSNKL